MSVVSVQAKSFILALFIRDDGERFLLGDNGYEFKDGQLHFNANDIENDEVAKQGADGVMLAGQVRRSSVQEFEGYVGDATDAKDTIEDKRKAFIAFFASGHHFRVVYVDCNSNAWQRKGGYLVDAPEVKELWQIHPEYHVGLNFEDVNYYSYNEDAEGDEILANYLNVPVSIDVSGGLEWDEDGAVSEDATIEYDTETKTATKGNVVSFSDGISAPIADIQIDGETSQSGTPTPSAPVPVHTVTGENVVKICGKNLFDKNAVVTGALMSNGTIDASYTDIRTSDYIPVKGGETYILSGVPGGWGSVGMYDSNKTFISRPYNGNGQYVIPANAAYARPVIVRGDLGTCQFELGSPATAYEPYQGQSYEVNLGKNLFDKNNMIVLDGQINSDKTYSSGGGKTFYIRCNPNTTYTIQKLDLTTSRSRLGSSSVYIPNGGTLTNYATMATISGSIRYGSITTGPNDTYLWVTYAATADSAEIQQEAIDSLQIEVGAQKTTYAAYFTPIELGKIPDTDYQDYIWNDNGTWKIHKAIGKTVFTGAESENWATRGGGTSYAYILQGVFDGSASYGLCNYWSFRRNGATSSQANECIASASTNTSISIFTNNSSLSSVANLKTWLNSNNVSVYYSLATSTDTTITNAALLAQLEAILAGGTQAGTNNIMLAPTAGPTGSLEVTYYTKYIVNVTAGGYVWEEGGSGGPTTVINDSISNVAPVWTIYGPTVNPVLENTTTGEEIEYVGTIADGQTLVIDMGEQTALLNGLNVIGNVTGDYVSLAPGQNTLLYSTSSGDTDSEIGWSEIVG